MSATFTSHPYPPANCRAMEPHHSLQLSGVILLITFLMAWSGRGAAQQLDIRTGVMENQVAGDIMMSNRLDADSSTDRAGKKTDSGVMNDSYLSTNEPARANEENGQLQITRHPLGPAVQAENGYRSAIAHLRRGALADAEVELQQALVFHPAHAQARERLIELMLQAGRLHDAQQVLDEGLKLTPHHQRFVMWQARILLELGNIEGALNYLEGVQIHTVQDADTLGLLAVMYHRLDRPADAREAYLKALALRPQEGRWWLGLGIVAETLQEWGVAREAYVNARTHGRLEEPLLDFTGRRLAIVIRQM